MSSWFESGGSFLRASYMYFDVVSYSWVSQYVDVGVCGRAGSRRLQAVGGLQ